MFDFLSIKKTFAWNFPNINPIAFSIGPLHIHWYGLGYLFGIILAYFYCNSLIQRSKLWAQNTPAITSAQLSDFIIWATLGIIIGGRLGEVLLWNPHYYWHHPAEIIAVWHGGMAFHGGLLGVLISGAIFSYRNKINYFALFDLISSGAPLGLGLVRICNFINGELWGKVTNVPWGMIFPHAGPIPRHPSQLYEAVLEGPILFTLLAVNIFIFFSLKKTGKTVGIFTAGYGLARIFAEMFREPDAAPAWFNTYLSNDIFSYGMFLSLPMVIIGIILIILSSK